MNYNKKIINDIIISNLPADSKYKNIDETNLYLIWWTTGKNSDNLRLTPQGLEAFTEAKIDFYDYSLDGFIDKNFLRSSHFLIKLKKISCPFFIERNYIRIYDSKIAMMINLYGSFYEYFKFLSTK